MLPYHRPTLPIPPREILERFEVHEPLDTRFQSCSRLLQSVWRGRRGYGVGSYTNGQQISRFLGSRLEPAAARAGDTEAGGLSGRPLSHRSTQVLEQFAERLPNSVALIGVGGIDNGQRAAKKIEAGADLIQLYSGLIYEGPELIQTCVEAIDGYRLSQYSPSTL